MRDELLRMAADRLELSPALVESLVRSVGVGEPGGARSAGGGSRDAVVGDELAPRGVERHAAGGITASDRRAATRPLARSEQTERAFLALCLALPDEGEAALGRLRPEVHFTSELTRRAASHLRDRLRSPGDGISEDDVELARLVAELSVRASSEFAHPSTLELEGLQLELAAVDREIASSRAAGRGDVAELASRRARVKVEVDKAVDRAMAAAGVGEE